MRIIVTPREQQIWWRQAIRVPLPSRSQVNTAIAHAAHAESLLIATAVRVRPFTIREAAQLQRTDGDTVFLGDGSLAAAPTPKLKTSGIRSVVKVVDDRCLYVYAVLRNPVVAQLTHIACAESLTPPRTTQSRNSRDR